MIIPIFSHFGSYQKLDEGHAPMHSAVSSVLILRIRSCGLSVVGAE